MSMETQNIETEVENTGQTIDGVTVLAFKNLDLINGLPGFENLHSFVLAELEGYAPFCAFQSVDQPEISMLVIDAKLLQVWKGIDLPPRELKILGMEESGESEQYVILKVNQESQEFTANIKAPIVFNPDSGAANQVILDNASLSVEHPIINELS